VKSKALRIFTKKYYLKDEYRALKAFELELDSTEDLDRQEWLHRKIMTCMNKIQQFEKDLENYM
jgi:hypothetical protein